LTSLVSVGFTIFLDFSFERIKGRILDSLVAGVQQACSESGILRGITIQISEDILHKSKKRNSLNFKILL